MEVAFLSMSGKLEVSELQKCPGSVAVVGALCSVLAFCLLGCLLEKWILIKLFSKSPFFVIVYFCWLFACLFEVFTSVFGLFWSSLALFLLYQVSDLLSQSWMCWGITVTHYLGLAAVCLWVLCLVYLCIPLLWLIYAMICFSSEIKKPVCGFNFWITDHI